MHRTVLALVTMAIGTVVGATAGPPTKCYPSLDQMEVRADAGKTVVIADDIKIVAPTFRADRKSATLTFEAKGQDWVVVQAPKMQDGPRVVKAKRVIVHLNTNIWEFQSTSGEEGSW
jgi:hypothetical protein